MTQPLGAAQAQTSTVQREELLNLLQEHLTNNVIRCGSTFLSQTLGIPQARHPRFAQAHSLANQ